MHQPLPWSCELHPSGAILLRDATGELIKGSDAKNETAVANVALIVKSVNGDTK